MNGFQSDDEFWGKELNVYAHKKQSGFEPIGNPLNFPAPCRDMGHNPPSHIVIPHGMQYRHVCPGCGQEAVIQSHAVY